MTTITATGAASDGDSDSDMTELFWARDNPAFRVGKTNSWDIARARGRLQLSLRRWSESMTIGSFLFIMFRTQVDNKNKNNKSYSFISFIASTVHAVRRLII